MRPRGHSLAQGLLNRELGRPAIRGYVSQQWQQGDLLSKLEFEASPTLVPLPPPVDTAGLPIVAKFNKNPSFGNGQLLAVGGEEGVVTIADTESVAAIERGSLDGSWRLRAHWPCHRNSIFDLAWAKNDSVLYTASGHQQVGMWDTDTARALAVAEGHEGSVKCVSPLHLCEDVFATGARDGRMMLWDARCPGFSGQAPAGGRRAQGGTDLDSASVISPVWVQENAHARPAAAAVRTSTKIAKPAAVTVTSVVFLPYSYLLASSGAHDTVVKLWDLRMQGLPLCDLELPKPAVRAGRAKSKAFDAGVSSPPHEVAEFACPTRASAVGVTHLAVSESGDRLLVSCLDSQHHLFSLSRLASGPLATWRAPPPAFKASFYMRSAFSPCGDYVLCGSRDCGAHIWHAADPQRAPIALPHEREVTGVAWCGGDWGKVATCSDSGEVRLWTLNRLPARETRRTAEEEDGDEAVPAMASHVTELEADGATVDAGAEQRLMLHKRGVEAETAAAAGQAAPATLPAPPSRKPVVRRTVQLRLNLLQAPVPTPPAPAAEAAVPPSRDPAGDPTNTNVALFAVMEAPGAAAAAHAAIAAKDCAMFQSPGGVRGGPFDGGKPPVCAAAVRATALASPVSSGPAYPACTPGPASVRRASMLPPVPIFSPAVNCWQQRPRADIDGGVAPAATAPPPPPPPEAARSGSAFACGGLEAAMKGLPHVRTQSPARMAARCGDEFGTGAELDAFAAYAARPGEPSSGQRDLLFTGKPPLPPSYTDLQQGQSFPPPSGSFQAARAPAVSPRATPGSFNRSRSRLGPFSPSRSSVSSGSGPFAGGTNSGGHSSGGACGTPTGSQQRYTPGSGQGHNHQQPQGVVDQILRNSPRYGSRTGPAGGGVDAMLSPRYRRTSAEDPEGGVQRRLFEAADGEAENAGPQQPRAGAAEATTAPLPVSGGAGHALRRGLGHGSGVDIVAAIDNLLQQSDGFEAAFLPATSTPRLSLSPVVYDVQDGQDVGPALRHRAENPDDMGPFVGLLDDGAAAGADQAAAGRNVAAMLFAWDGFVSSDRLAGAGDDGREGEWALRRSGGGESGGGFLVPSGGRQADDDDDDDDSDWDFDPYGDKENTPPPEPLPPAAPTSSTSAGGSGAPFASPSSTQRDARGPEDDQPLPLPLLQPASSTPTRSMATASAAMAAATTTAAAAAPAAAAPATPSAQGRARMATPFAGAHSFPFPFDFAPPQPEAVARAESAPSLRNEPTVSAGIAPSSSSGGGAADSYQSSGSADNGEVVDEMPSLGPSCLMRAFAGSPDGAMDSDGVEAAVAAAAVHKQQPGHHRLLDTAVEEIAGGEGGVSARADTLTPTKRPRRSHSFSDDHGSPTNRSPSPTRRVRSSGLLAGPAAPTPRRAGAYAAAMPSPCVRGGGRSRLAPAPGAGYLVTAAVTAAAGIGSESPMPKVGTASRTGNRHTAASEEFFCRRAAEERDRANMSPFGFGMFASAETLGGGGGQGSTRPPRTASRLAHQDAGFAAAVPQLPMVADDAAREDDEMGPVHGSVRSLSCVFETQTQGGSTQLVPCTYPAEEDAVGEVAREAGQVRRLELLPSFEERTMASPLARPTASSAGGLGIGAADDCDGGGYFEPGATDGGEPTGRKHSFHFPSVFARASQQQPQNSRQAAAAPALQFILDESSRSFPVAAAGEGLAARGGGVGLQTAWSGHGMTGPAQSGLSFGGAAGLHELLALSSGPVGTSAGPQQPSALLAAFPRLSPDAGRNADPLDGPCTAEQPQLQAGFGFLRRHRQQTLQQCWEASQRHPTPVAMRPAAAAPPLPPSRPLGPTGLTSPKYFR